MRHRNECSYSISVTGNRNRWPTGTEFRCSTLLMKKNKSRHSQKRRSPAADWFAMLIGWGNLSVRASTLTPIRPTWKQWGRLEVLTDPSSQTGWRMIRVFSRLIGKGIDDENSQMVEPFQGTTVGDQLQLGCGTSLASSERQSYIYPRSGFWISHWQEAVFEEGNRFLWFVINNVINY